MHTDRRRAGTPRRSPGAAFTAVAWTSGWAAGALPAVEDAVTVASHAGRTLAVMRDHPAAEQHHA
ncbi:hypothetical protein ACFXPI_21325 [Streptomyces sp. NPDC059104]|uniref:hypothetical protein n=1 Tax=Streptomyces sp. NPDC059104 TaxID=3346729 RepID=UPI0036CF7C26